MSLVSISSIANWSSVETLSLMRRSFKICRHWPLQRSWSPSLLRSSTSSRFLRLSNPSAIFSSLLHHLSRKYFNIGIAISCNYGNFLKLSKRCMRSSSSFGNAIGSPNSWGNSLSMSLKEEDWLKYLPLYIPWLLLLMRIWHLSFLVFNFSSDVVSLVQFISIGNSIMQKTELQKKKNQNPIRTLPAPENVTDDFGFYSFSLIGCHGMLTGLRSVHTKFLREPCNLV